MVRVPKLSTSFLFLSCTNAFGGLVQPWSDTRISRQPDIANCPFLHFPDLIGLIVIDNKTFLSILSVYLREILQWFCFICSEGKHWCPVFKQAKISPFLEVVTKLPLCSSVILSQSPVSLMQVFFLHRSKSFVELCRKSFESRWTVTISCWTPTDICSKKGVTLWKASEIHSSWLVHPIW